ncbi:MAG TPA: hypothetical protein GXX29_14310 [Firmicutes bacterium]|nr:hypothetical protein [Bacillota bacterium]
MHNADTYRKLNADTYVDVLAEEVPRLFTFSAKDRREAEEWQKAFRPALIKALGIEQIANRGPAPLKATCLSVETLEDHVREEWRLETEPGFQLPFYLLKPLAAAPAQEGGAGKRLPLVITPHGHGKLGKRTYVGLWDNEDDRQQMMSGERDVALQAVREGYLAIAPDMRGFAGLRRTKEINEDANNSCRHLQMHAYLFGRTLVGERVWDIMRLIDWATARPDVDARKIVVTGNSGGGTVTLFAGAVDERITVSIPGSYFCTFQHSIGSVRHCECNYVPGIMCLGEMYDVAGLIAPRPFMAVNGNQDRIFPIEAARYAYFRLLEIYRVFGVPERCRLSENEGPHRYYKRDVWPFVREMLALV